MSIERERLLSSIQEKFVILDTHLRVGGALGDYSLNHICEDVFVSVFKELFEAPDLKNLNEEYENAASIDLFSEQKSLAIQVTTTNNAAKVNHTLETFYRHRYYKLYSRLLVFVITYNQIPGDVYKRNQDKADQCGFDYRRDVINLKGVLTKIRHCAIERIRAIDVALRKEIDTADLISRIKKGELESKTDIENKLKRELASGKYIPEVYIEEAALKDKIRFFVFFSGYKTLIRKELQRIDHAELNRLLERVGFNPVLSDFDPDKCTFESVSRYADELKQYGFMEYHRIKGLSVEQKEYYDLISFNIAGAAEAVLKHVRLVKSAYELSNAKIFIISGDAGCGKTNFICDLVQNTFVPKNIPTVFLTSEDLCLGTGSLFERIVRSSQLLQSVEGSQARKIEEVSRAYEKMGKHLIIIFEGLNEVRDVSGIIHELTAFVERCLPLDGVKFLITCRDQFRKDFLCNFENNFRSYTRSDVIRVAYNDEGRLGCMWKGYKRHFNVNCSIAKSVVSELKQDPLLMRIFCEAYANETETGEIIDTLSKSTLFERYHAVKRKYFLERMSEYRSVYDDMFLNVIQKMVKDGRYVWFSRDNLNIKEKECLDNLVSEEVFFKRDLAADSGWAVKDKYAFTFDEFRDFCVAQYLVNNFSEENFDFVIERLNSDDCPYEGIVKFLYVLLRKKGDYKLSGLLEENTKIGNVLFDCIIEVDENFLMEDDVDKLAKCIVDSPSSNKLHKLILRAFRRREPLYARALNKVLDDIEKCDESKVKKLTKCLNEVLCKQYKKILYYVRDDHDNKNCFVEFLYFLERVGGYIHD